VKIFPDSRLSKHSDTIEIPVSKAQFFLIENFRNKNPT
jgi:hypothetical protein